MSTFVVVSLLLLSSIFAVDARLPSTPIQLTKKGFPKASIFTKSMFGGMQGVVTVSENCTSLRQFPYFDKNIRSLKVAKSQYNDIDGCVKLYKTYDCSGPFFPVTRLKGINLGEWSAAISSISACSRSSSNCTPGNSSTSLLHIHYFTEGEISVYSYPDECSRLPMITEEFFMHVDYEYNKNACIEVYEGFNCTGKSIQLNGGRMMQYLKHTVRSISLCDFICRRELNFPKSRRRTELVQKTTPTRSKPTPEGPTVGRHPGMAPSENMESIAIWIVFIFTIVMFLGILIVFCISYVDAGYLNAQSADNTEPYVQL